ncbi:class E sortase [Streptomyces sp. CB03911]|uniref:class E sortase n=1 Tax=Streptomyces sp. CB03911 TaxID=1804758 RepID=UPI00093B291F|nr:class E sortase [Streptomyces sp. CB03911]
MRRNRAVPVALAGAVLALLAGCATPHAADPPAAARPATPTPTSSTAPTSPAAASPSAPSAPPSDSPTPAPDTRTLTATLTIPSIGVTGLPVVPYEGTTDDLAGTRIQDGGVAASPYGETGGVGPGQVGNYLVTAHRLSAGGPLRNLPELAPGELVTVTVGGTVYTYEITASRTTSFRSERSLAEQRAAVPGSPGVTPTEAMITISTCATPEDNAAGNRWRDDRGNPEHRIDKAGVLRGRADATTG